MTNAGLVETLDPNEQGHRLLADAIVRALSSGAPSLGR